MALTQVELSQIKGLLEIEELAVSKYGLYSEQTTDQEVKRLFESGATVHKENMMQLMQLLGGN